MAHMPRMVERAAVGFGLDPERLRPLGGRTHATWSDGDVVLRVGERVASELAAAAAAADRVPVPAVLDRLDVEGSTAVLLEKVTGRPAGELAIEDPGAGAAAGRACAALHDALAHVAAPAGVRDAPDAGGSARRLLHLDLHPFNVLVDDDGEPTAVIDWANAAAGEPELDRARTWSLLTLDPAARALDQHPGWAALTEHWLDAGRLRGLSSAARMWACRFMLHDLAGRHAPAEVAHIHDAIGRADVTGRKGPRRA